MAIQGARARGLPGPVSAPNSSGSVSSRNNGSDGIPAHPDQVLGRAVQTVERLLAEIKASQDEIARLDLSGPDLEQAPTQSRSAEETVGAVFADGERAADGLLEQARRDAERMTAEARRETLPVLAEAQRTLEEARRLQRDAQAMVAQARQQAEAFVESAAPSASD